MDGKVISYLNKRLPVHLGHDSASRTYLDWALRTWE